MTERRGPVEEQSAEIQDLKPSVIELKMRCHHWQKMNEARNEDTRMDD